MRRPITTTTNAESYLHQVASTRCRVVWLGHHLSPFTLLPPLPMARHQTTVSTTQSVEQLSRTLDERLAKLGYKPLDPADQNVWRKGGFMANPMFIRYEVTPGELLLEVWVRMVLLPGVYLGEQDLDGMLLVVQKRTLRKHLDELEKLAG